MNISSAIMAAALCAVALASQAQTAIEKAPDPLTKKAPGTKAPPTDGATRGMPDAASGMPANSGIVKVPPTTGTEEMVTQPRNVDPGIAAPTKGIDRKNQQESEEKTTKPKR
jgi:hypothetical protein